jgi:aldehyde:ferredoxin oxidoreductase
MSSGFHNRILRVNLTTREISVEQPGEDFYRTYIGGWGLIAYYLLKETRPGTEPLGPDNVLVFAPGVLTGIPAGGSGRNAVGAISPLTGGFGEADVGGFWGAELKRAGWDAIVVTGHAMKPTSWETPASASLSAGRQARISCAMPVSSTTSPGRQAAPAWAP